MTNQRKYKSKVIFFVSFILMGLSVLFFNQMAFFVAPWFGDDSARSCFRHADLMGCDHIHLRPYYFTIAVIAGLLLLALVSGFTWAYLWTWHKAHRS